MNIIFNTDSKKEILLGCTKIEIIDSTTGVSSSYMIKFYNIDSAISVSLSAKQAYPADKECQEKFNKLIIDEIANYLVSNKENLIWREFEEEVYNKYKSLNEKSLISRVKPCFFYI